MAPESWTVFAIWGDLLMAPSAGSLLNLSVSQKISQAELNTLYLASRDNLTYRPVIEGEGYFRLAALLRDHGYAPDLSELSLRNWDLRNTDFTGINLDQTDLRGANCSGAVFTGVMCLDIVAGPNTRLFKAKITEQQLLRLKAKPIRARNSELNIVSERVG